MRIRTVKPEFWESESLARCEREARLLFIGLFNLADDAGIFRASPVFIGGHIFPYDTFIVPLIEDWMRQLEEEDCIHTYSVDGSRYGLIVNFHRHQVINKPSRGKYPARPAVDESRSDPGALPESSGNTTCRKGKEGKGKEGKGISSTGVDSAASPPGDEPAEIQASPVKSGDQLHLNPQESSPEGTTEVSDGTSPVPASNPKPQKRYESIQAKTRKVLDFIGFIKEAPRPLEGEGKIPERLKGGASVYDCLLVFWWAKILWAGDGDKYCNQVSPFRKMNFERLLDEARIVLVKGHKSQDGKSWRFVGFNQRFEEAKAQGILDELSLSVYLKSSGFDRDGNMTALQEWAEHGRFLEEGEAS